MNQDERLTQRGVDQIPISKDQICLASPTFCHDYDCKECPIGKLINRLCEYEDTGLSPEEIVELKGKKNTAIVRRCLKKSIKKKETTIENCTVQILENTVTGEVSVGWRKNEAPLHHGDLIDRDALIESFRTSGQFDISELGAIIPIIEEQPVINIREEYEV